MLCKKNHVIVGLTTFHNEMLKISIPALGKLKQKFLLIIHNDNPTTNITKRDIRKLGYKGDLHIINSNENLGPLMAKVSIIKTADKLKLTDTWIVFNDDDDILTDLTIPDVAANNFAIIQNSITIKNRVLDLLRVMDKPDNYVVDNEHIILSKPNRNITGTLIKTKHLVGMADILLTISDALLDIERSLTYRVPVDMIMWSLLNTYVKSMDANAFPIYMDKINYIKTDLDSCQIKYGKLKHPVRNADEHYKKLLSKYESAFHIAMDAAALRG